MSAARAVARELSRTRATGIAALPRATPRRTDPLVGFVTHAGLYLAVLAGIAAFFSAAFGHGSWQGQARIGIGCVLTLEGILLVTDWRGARRLLLGRMHARSTARSGAPTTLVEVLRWRLIGPLLAALALAAVCVGLILVGQGASDLV